MQPSLADRLNPIGGMSTAGKQYRALEQSYGRALRILNHAARRGNAQAALQAIKVRQEAMGGGFAPGGIRKVDERMNDINSMEAQQAQGAQDLEQVAANNRLAAADARRFYDEQAARGTEPTAQGSYEDTESGRPVSPSRAPANAAPYYGDIETGGAAPDVTGSVPTGTEAGYIVNPKTRGSILRSKLGYGNVFNYGKALRY